MRWVYRRSAATPGRPIRCRPGRRRCANVCEPCSWGDLRLPPWTTATDHERLTRRHTPQDSVLPAAGRHIGRGHCDGHDWTVAARVRPAVIRLVPISANPIRTPGDPPATSGPNRSSSRAAPLTRPARYSSSVVPDRRNTGVRPGTCSAAPRPKRLTSPAYPDWMELFPARYRRETSRTRPAAPS